MGNNENRQTILQAAEKKQAPLDARNEAIKGAIDELRSRTEAEGRPSQAPAPAKKPRMEAVEASLAEAAEAPQTETREIPQPAETEAPRPETKEVPRFETKEALLPQAKPEQKPQHPILRFGQEPVLPYSIEEAINRLRINISFLGTDVKKIMIVSSEPNEGKSFTSMNLWKQMAIAGEPSILLDLDMRKSTMAAKYAMERTDGKELKGTSHFLSGEDPIEEMILHTAMEHGDILPNVDNIVNPSMLLESRKFTEMMKYMEEHYRYVFVDVPPLGLVSDGELIGSVCDGAVLCVRAGVTSRSIVRRSIRQLERAGCPVLGITLNRVGAAGSKYYGKYYGKKYYYNDQYYSQS